MGHKHDQEYIAPVNRPPGDNARPIPPPLPPRVPSNRSSLDVPPPYSELPKTFHSQPLTSSWTAQDPRSSSTQSLVPQDSTSNSNKRTLLLIYIHGFMGNETSFQSFPAHVHNAVTEELRETHVVHTKIYPKYKTRKKVEDVKEDFSKWLVPHESPGTDIILLGHSMGGILSAEVALLEPHDPGSTRKVRHRILGTINFDTPFLGMHPGVIASGLGSLFRPAPDSPRPPAPIDDTAIQEQGLGPPNAEAASGDVSYFPNSTNKATALLAAQNTSSTNLSLSSSLPLPTSDPNYDPPFPNDVRIPQRTGWSNAWHFINKHSDGLARATKSYVTSHLEFGGALADYNALRYRYGKIKGLEDGGAGERVRFVNYYTASTGRPKKIKDEEQSGGKTESQAGSLELGTENLSSEAGEERPGSVTPSISIKGTGDTSPIVDSPRADPHVVTGGIGLGEGSNSLLDNANLIAHIDPTPEVDDDNREAFDRQITQDQDADCSKESSTTSPGQSLRSPPSWVEISLPPIPSLPAEPKPFDCDSDDKGVRRIAEQQYQRELKAYQRSVKDRDKAINDRRKYLEKREKDLAKEREKEIKRDEKERLKAEKDEAKGIAKAKAKADETSEKSRSGVDGAALTPIASAVGCEHRKDEDKKSPRDKKFCLLPPKANGRPDPCWARVFMPDVDEVGAHCGLFFVDGERYEWFVRDVSQRIVEWVRNA